MKSNILNSLGILSVILFYACGTDSVETIPASAYVSHLKSESLNIEIGNKGNPFDAIGSEYRDFLSDYKSGNYNPQNYADIQVIVNTLTNGSQLPATEQLLSLCMNNPDLAMSQILEQSGLSMEGRELLEEFVADYSNLSELPFSSAYDQLVALENAVGNSVTLPDQDQRVILSVASITRYSLYHSCCEDTDWKKSVGNIIAAVAGAVENNSQAIQYPLITSIAGLEKIQF